MGETRDPGRGSWTLFEGDAPVVHAADVRFWGRFGGVNGPLEFPITLRLVRIVDGVSVTLDVEVDADFRVASVERQEYPLRVEGLPDDHGLVAYDVVPRP